MYANLKVTVGDHEPIFAWRVKILGEKVSVFMDANNGDSDHAEPDGVVELDATTLPAIMIEADF